MNYTIMFKDGTYAHFPQDKIKSSNVIYYCTNCIECVRKKILSIYNHKNAEEFQSLFPCAILEIETGKIIEVVPYYKRKDR